MKCYTAQRGASNGSEVVWSTTRSRCGRRKMVAVVGGGVGFVGVAGVVVVVVGFVVGVVVVVGVAGVVVGVVVVGFVVVGWNVVMVRMMVRMMVMMRVMMKAKDHHQ